VNLILARWNAADPKPALETMLDCCGAQRWAAAMVDRRPIASENQLHEMAGDIWNSMTEPDWLEAFACHPKIGERKAPHASHQSSTWSGQEQSSIQAASDAILTALGEGNARYEGKFGFTYIVCATGKSPEQMLSLLESRLANTRECELSEAARQQKQIMHIRLRKWLEQ
jgi:2-oxo-4-hydroxy-4-carboxy-5-ureidoimidazoline decarboxylase